MPGLVVIFVLFSRMIILIIFFSAVIRAMNGNYKFYQTSKLNAVNGLGLLFWRKCFIHYILPHN